VQIDDYKVIFNSTIKNWEGDCANFDEISVKNQRYSLEIKTRPIAASTISSVSDCSLVNNNPCRGGARDFGR
jgi:hypothetical protein